MSETKEYILFCDGASRGNPGPGSYGYVIFQSDTVVAEGKAKLGNVTNNFAEYQALISGLAHCQKLGADAVVVKSDSQLLVRQLNGQYKVRSPQIRPLFDQAKKLVDDFNRIEILHIPREENSHADALANEALDSK